MRASIFGSIDHSASESWCDVCVVLSSSQCAGSRCLRFTILSGGNIRDELAPRREFESPRFASRRLWKEMVFLL